MPSKSFLRILIVVEIGLAILGGVVSQLTASLLPESLRAFSEAKSQVEQSLVTLRVAFPLIILSLVSSIGLFFFWRPSRILYLISSVLGLLLAPSSAHMWMRAGGKHLRMRPWSFRESFSP
jgi:hypothetical protein